MAVDIEQELLAIKNEAGGEIVKSNIYSALSKLAESRGGDIVQEFEAGVCSDAPEGLVDICTTGLSDTIILYTQDADDTAKSSTALSITVDKPALLIAAAMYRTDHVSIDESGWAEVAVCGPDGSMYTQSVAAFSKTVQAGEHTVTFQTSSDNLFDKDDMTSGGDFYINSSAKIAASSNCSCFILPCEPNMRYTVTRQVILKRFAIGFVTDFPLYANESVYGMQSDNDASSLMSTSDSSSRYLVVYYAKHSGSDSNTAEEIQSCLDTMTVVKGKPVDTLSAKLMAFYDVSDVTVVENVHFAPCAYNEILPKTENRRLYLASTVSRTNADASNITYDGEALVIKMSRNRFAAFYDYNNGIDANPGDIKYASYPSTSTGMTFLTLDLT